MAVRDQPPGDVKADESGAAGDQNSHTHLLFARPGASATWPSVTSMLLGISRRSLVGSGVATSDRASGHARHDRHGRNVLGNHRARSDNGTPPDHDAVKDAATRSKPDVVLDTDALGRQALSGDR